MSGVSPLQRLDTVATGVLGLLQQRGNQQVAGAARGVKQMTQEFGKFVAMRSVEIAHGTYLPRGIVVTIAKSGRKTVADTGSIKVQITGAQFRRDFIQYALAETIAAESQAVR